MTNDTKQSDDLLDQLLHLTRKITDVFRRELHEECQHLAGPFYEKMTESCHAAEGFLQHKDRNVRLAALKVLTYVWRPQHNSSAATIIERMASEDNDQEMQTMAVHALVECYCGTSEPRIMRLLAEIVVDESQQVVLRKLVYHFLYKMQGRDAPLRPGGRMSPPTEFWVPEDVDWTFVKSFL